jgi:predicted Rossmann fold nucleotide-binding protein DprA/Smf involved in DNA uptake
VSQQGCSVISGGARGVDETAMFGALTQDGTVIGVLADKLLYAATSAKYRKWLMTKNLVLVSPFNPDTGFEIGNAMARNRYIYCLADAAVVITATKNKGGTWHGAVENLKHGWVPLWVKQQADPASGNTALVGQGGRWLPQGVNATAEVGKVQPSMATLFDQIPVTSEPRSTTDPSSAGEAKLPANSIVEADSNRRPEQQHEGSNAMERLSFYELFLLKLSVTAGSDPVTPAVLQEELQVVKSQLTEWLTRAVKLNNPVRYRLADIHQGNLEL